VKRTALFCIATQLFLLPVLPQATAPALPKEEATLQRFVCNTGYTQEKCHKDVAVLRSALAKYPIAQLGNWTWILVRSEDWKAILVPGGLDPDSPAFTYCPKKRDVYRRGAGEGSSWAAPRIAAEVEHEQQGSSRLRHRSRVGTCAL
jgi:hypothetical protein